MKNYNQAGLKKYLKKDIVFEQLKQYSSDAVFSSHKWLLDMPAKRFIYNDVYGGFLKTKGKKILDIGGGFCGLTRELIKNHDYTLIDIMAHDRQDVMGKISSENGDFWRKEDWLNFKPTKHYDCVIANDIFPNVDQRIKMFIEKFKPLADNIIVTLTCYDSERYYVVKRLEADEILTVVPWSSTVTEMVLRQSVSDKNLRLPKAPYGPSMFKNGRIVFRLDL